MSDLAGLLYTAKDKIMILRSVKFLPEAASFTYNRLSGNKKSDRYSYWSAEDPD